MASRLTVIGYCLLVIGMASCSDFDDYNKAGVDAVASANQTLWQNISQEPRLSDFKALLQRAGFGGRLDTTQYYTVWAPLNGTFDPAVYQGMTNQALLKQFVENHIARYSHNATGQMDERVMMLNEKTYSFSGNKSYTFDGRPVSTPNVPSNNGVLHYLDGAALYYPSLYEFINDTDLSGAYGIDSLRNFYKRYEMTYLDEKASVLGPIVNGMQTYVDSVMITTNSLWSSLNAKINVEDSSYTYLMPTNEAWLKQYEKIESCFNYAPVTTAQLFVTSGGSTKIDDKVNAVINLTAPKDEKYWRDSLTNHAMTTTLVYSNNDIYNRWLNGNPTAYGSDTLRSTSFIKLSNPQDILAATTATVPMSNGTAHIIDSFAMLPWETYMPERRYSATNSRNQANITSGGSYTRVEVINPSPDKVQLEDGATSFTYAWMEPTGGSQYVKPELTLYLRNVLSTTYDLYCVFVPENVDPQKADVVTNPNLVVFTLSYCDAEGKLQEKTFLNEDSVHMAYIMDTFNLKDTQTNRNTIRAFENDTSRVDTLYIGEFTFPVCYYGLDSEESDAYCPNIKISTPFSPFTAALRNAFSRDLRIAAIILKPKELVDYENNNNKR